MEIQQAELKGRTTQTVTLKRNQMLARARNEMDMATWSVHEEEEERHTAGVIRPEHPEIANDTRSASCVTV